MLDLKKFILAQFKDRPQIRTQEIVKTTGYSRSYVAKILKQLTDSKKLYLVGKANAAYYTQDDPTIKVTKQFVNKKLQEDIVLSKIKKSHPQIFAQLPENISHILDYSYLEMLNNAIEHSNSEKISITFQKSPTELSFQIRDYGIGIYNKLRKKHKLKNDLHAIQQLLKGKQTTAPKEHSGEGIFFTSKMADTFSINSFQKKLEINNNLPDIFISDIKKLKGTEIDFRISLKSQREITEVFRQYTDTNFAFDKTQITVELYKMEQSYLSRSQARRITQGLEKFRIIIFDFQNIPFIGQAFADEIFRVWQNKHQDIRLEYINQNENVEFMIKRALSLRS